MGWWDGDDKGGDFGVRNHLGEVCTGMGLDENLGFQRRFWGEIGRFGAVLVPNFIHLWRGVFVKATLVSVR